MKAERIARLLPEIFQATVGQAGPLDGFLAAQERLHGPCEAAISDFPQHLDARTGAPRFIFMLAAWMDLDYLFDGPSGAPHFAPGVGRLRALVATAARNGRERGTSRMLVRLLETATGCRGFVIETDAGGTFHFTVTVPRQALPFRSLVMRIVEAEKPAFATCELRFPAEPDEVDAAYSAEH